MGGTGAALLCVVRSGPGLRIAVRLALRPRLLLAEREGLRGLLGPGIAVPGRLRGTGSVPGVVLL